MRYKWLNKTENEKLIVFFNGWGMDESVIEHLDKDAYDILMFYDYNTLDTDFVFFELSNYKKKYLVAWSMGVMMATMFDVDYISKTAINGTLKPIDDNCGIPVRIYNLTVKGFSSKGAERFIKSMYNEECELPHINRDFENQKSELSALMDYKANPRFKYDRIIISSDDKIIPTKNQVAFWGRKPNLDSGHAPFYKFKKWSELL